MVYHAFLDAAEQIPYDHPSQMKLARLVFALRGTPKTATVEKLGPTKDDPRYRFDFTALHDVISGRWLHPFNDLGYKSLDKKGKVERAQRWINANVFYANISVWSWDKTSSYMRRVMVLAFGDPVSERYGFEPYMGFTRHDKSWRDPHVSAAAQWIIYSGQHIFREVMNPSDTVELKYEHPLRRLQAEPLSEWRRWKQGFRDVSNDPERQDEARALAKRAANLMEALEENMMLRWGRYRLRKARILRIR
ncbi:hypothetical protein PG984_006995 [Apiospora sp. TS-2023a]